MDISHRAFGHDEIPRSDYLVPIRLGGARRLLREMESREKELLSHLEKLVGDWNSLFRETRFIDLVLQQQGNPKVLWRQRMRIAGKQGYVDLFAEPQALSKLPEHVAQAAEGFEAPRVLFNARMRAVRGTRQALEYYLEAMSHLRNEDVESF